MRILSVGSGLVVAAAVLLIGLQAFAQTPGWIGDRKTGCKVWNPAPQAHESITWSGPCKDGYAQGDGTVQWFENGRPGDKYDGQYQHGKRNGHGIVTESNGTRVEGDWLDDQLLQQGVNEIDLRLFR